VRRITESRLREAESRAPKPFESLTIVHTIVAPNGPGGCDGPPIDCGVCERTKTIPRGYLKETWSEPYPAKAELPDELLVSQRHRYGVDELFVPPVRESELPADAGYGFVLIPPSRVDGKAYAR
jgi:hypothetical protein